MTTLVFANIGRVIPRQVVHVSCGRGRGGGLIVDIDRETELEVLIRAKYPLIYLLSWEERRVEAMLRRVAASRKKRLYAWSVTEGVVAIDTVRPTPVDPNAKTPLKALEYIAQARDPAIFVLKDLHFFLHSDGPNLYVPGLEAITLVRKLRDMVEVLKQSQKTLCLLSPVLRFPIELEKDITVLDCSLPTRQELSDALARVIRSARNRGSTRGSRRLQIDLDKADRDRVLKAAAGLTASEAENVFAKSLVMTRRLDLDVIVAEKKQLIQKSRVLEYHDAVQDMAYVGGMAELKTWLGKRSLAFSERARRFGLPEPRGLLLLGVQGGGKSLLAKSVAGLWKLPLLRLDMGKVFSEMVGASEQNIRTALRLAESVAPCVLWLDEMEKGLSGLGSSNRSDAGTAARVFGSFLVWMQEKTAPVFVIATCNDISSLPPEILRKGRFDEIFFIDLPRREERQEILSIHLAKRHRDPLRFDLVGLAQETEGFSGAEIEQAIISALYDAFEADRELTDQDLHRNIQQTVPLSQTMKERITALRNWARTHARMASLDVGATVPWMAASDAAREQSIGSREIALRGKEGDR
jgi:SpoVK/Ycf46/Vps4 family AAA+-type ATPase